MIQSLREYTLGLFLALKEHTENKLLQGVSWVSRTWAIQRLRISH